MATLFTPTNFSPYPWLEFAFQELGYGVHEISGAGSNAHITEYLRYVGLSNASDETAWCSAFANWCMQQAGLAGTGRANARSWMDWGGMCLAQAVYGCVTVLWRDSPSSWKGHVGFYLGSEGNQILLLGGNQGDAVSVAPYPRSRVLGYRWPAELALPQ